MAKLLSEVERFEQEVKELGYDIAPLTGGGASVSLAPPRPPVPSVISAPPIASSSAQPQPHPSASPSFVPQTSVRPPPSRPSSSVPPVPTSISTATPWLLNPGGVSTAANSSTSSQFTYATSGLPFPPAQPANASVSSNPSGSYFPVPIHLQQQTSQYQSQPYMQFPQQIQQSVVKTPQYTYQAVYQAPTDIFSLPQQQQAQQLFQRDAQTITPEALESVKAALASGDNDHKAEAKKKAIPRKAAGQVWEDSTLADWPENDFRLFCGDLGNEVNDEVLTKAFSRYTSFNMARVVRDKRTGKTKGYGFVSFSTPSDLALALKEMNGKYVGNRPIKLRKSSWKERTDMEALSKHKNKQRQKPSKKNILHK